LLKKAEVPFNRQEGRPGDQLQRGQDRLMAGKLQDSRKDRKASGESGYNNKIFISRDYAATWASAVQKWFWGALIPSLTPKGASFCSQIVSWEA